MGYSISATEYVASVFGTVILPSLTYGVNMILVSLVLGPLWKRRKADNSKRPILLTAHIVHISALCTAHWIISCIQESKSLIVLVDLSQGRGGSLGDTREDFAANLLYVFLTIHTDALMVGHHHYHEVHEILKHLVAVAVLGALF